MSRPLLLDLFCGAGGAAEGYYRAGFDIVGVDREPQPDYPFEFFQVDALLTLDRLHLDLYPLYGARTQDFDVIHASPPCQAYTTMANRYRGAGGKADSHDALIAETRDALTLSGVPYVIENVVGARREMRDPITLHGGMFGLGVYRPRLFESNASLTAPPPAPKPPGVVAVYGKLDGRRVWTRNDGSELRCVSTLKEGQEAMGMDWSDWHGLTEAIPPAYTEWIGRQLYARQVNVSRPAASPR